MTKRMNVDEPTWGLFARENTKDLNERKSIKVKLPIRQHIRLHAMKLFTESNISETVEAALDRYFQEMKREQEAAEALGEGTVVNDVATNVDVGVSGTVAGTTASDE